jgi:hypothetical protein
VTTMVIILVTVFAFGGSTEAMLAFLQIETDVDEEKYMENWHQERRSATILLRIEDLIQHYVVRQDLDSVLSGERLNQLNLSAHVECSHAPGSYSHVGEVEDENIQTTANGEPMTPTNTNIGASKARQRSSLFDYGANQ